MFNELLRGTTSDLLAPVADDENKPQVLVGDSAYADGATRDALEAKGFSANAKCLRGETSPGHLCVPPNATVGYPGRACSGPGRRDRCSPSASASMPRRSSMFSAPESAQAPARLPAPTISAA